MHADSADSAVAVKLGGTAVLSAISSSTVAPGNTVQFALSMYMGPQIYDYTASEYWE